MKIEIRHEFELSGDDERQIVALLGEAFDVDFGGRSYFHQPPHARFLARDEAGSIIGHVGLFLCRMSLGDVNIRVGGLGDVAVAKSARGLGVASALLERLEAEARDRALLFLLLDGDAGIYHRAGYREIGNRVLVHGRAGLTEIESHRIMMLETGPQSWNDSPVLDFLGPLF